MPKKRFVRRATPLDEGQQREVLAIVAVGGTRRVAAKYVRQPTAAIEATCAQDPEFALRMRNAEARLEVLQLRNIEQAGEKNWRASAWLLERMYPDRYGTKKPRVLTAEQAAALWERLTQIVLGEVVSKRARARISKRFDDVAQSLADEVDSSPCNGARNT